MATRAENERLAVLETKVENIEEGIEKLDAKFDAILEKLDDRYVPRSEHKTIVERVEALERPRPQVWYDVPVVKNILIALAALLVAATSWITARGGF